MCVFRFPIPDLTERKERPWWKRHLRKELLIVRLQEAYLETAISPHNPVQQLEISCRGGLGGLWMRFRPSVTNYPAGWVWATIEKG